MPPAYKLMIISDSPPTRRCPFSTNRGSKLPKFLVLTNSDQPVAVWTGSTNLTQGAIFGHLNVGHLIHDPALAAQFVTYWTRLADPAATTGILRGWTELNNPVDLTSTSAPQGLTTVLSPRATTS